MRKIAIVGVDKESETVECEIAETGEKLALPLDDTFRAAARGEFGNSAEHADAPAPATDSDSATTEAANSEDSAKAASDGEDAESASDATLPAKPEPSLAAKKPSGDDGGDADSLAAVSSLRPEPGGNRPSARQVPERNALRPKDLQARVRAGATVEELCESTGMPFTRVEAFAYPILQERAAKAETARRAHPLLADGPSVDTVESLVRDSLEDRGVDPELLRWDSWRLKSGNWTVQAKWPAGLSDDASALWEYVPDSHGGVAHPLDDEAVAIGDPELRKPLGVAGDNDEAATAYDAAHNMPAGEAYPGDLRGAHYGPTNGESWPRSFPASVTGIGGRRVPHDPSNQPAPYVLGRPIELDPNAGHPGASPSPAPAHGASGQRGPTPPAETGRPQPSTRNGSAADAPVAGSPSTPTSGAGKSNGRENDDEFLMHPPTEGGAHRAKGKHPTMPSWEDVLLGVRSPKDSK